ncbi:hypothetical protein HPB50_014422 [Hyalomma asiaticum]|uniref:Uncharacterized protein n=1 Tax=Hyalomma asiaticum TaxID=266040 RepID=A0ACB7TIA3_HYAAI|nr:hypothetical protein HPB50_014422 [Hyalomma asiaticum]
MPIECMHERGESSSRRHDQPDDCLASVPASTTRPPLLNHGKLPQKGNGRRQHSADKLTACNQLQEFSSPRSSRPMLVTMSSGCSCAPWSSIGFSGTYRFNNNYLSRHITSILKTRARPLLIGSVFASGCRKDATDCRSLSVVRGPAWLSRHTPYAVTLRMRKARMATLLRTCQWLYFCNRHPLSYTNICIWSWTLTFAKRAFATVARASSGSKQEVAGAIASCDINCDRAQSN